MRYFRLDRDKAHDVQMVVWSEQVEHNAPLTKFSSIGIGRDTCMWTEDEEAEKMVVQILLDQHIMFQTVDYSVVQAMQAQMPF